MCNVAISTVLMYCFVTLVRLSLVTNKGYLLTYLLTYRRFYDFGHLPADCSGPVSVPAARNPILVSSAGLYLYLFYISTFPLITVSDFGLGIRVW